MADFCLLRQGDRSCMLSQGKFRIGVQAAGMESYNLCLSKRVRKNSLIG